MGVSGIKVSDYIRTQLASLKAQGLSQKKAAKQLGISCSTAARYWTDPTVAPSGVSEVLDFTDESKETRTLSFVVDKPISTKEEALEASKVDTTIWTVDRWEVSHYTVPMKLHPGYEPSTGSKERYRLPDQPICTQMSRVKLYLKRAMPKFVHDVMSEVVRQLEERPVSWPTIHTRQYQKAPRMLEVDFFDIHYGKRAWAVECGQNYDLQIARKDFRNAAEDILDEYASQEFDEIIFPIGNDFLNIDNLRGQTESGTPVDTDSRLFKIAVEAEIDLIDAIERFATIAPVKGIFVPDNHSPTITFGLCRTIMAYFRSTDRVTIDWTPRARKYHRYGSGLLGLAHGHQVKPDRLPILMANECKDIWSETSWCEWHLGHIHREKKFETLPAESYNGVTVRYLRALSATDAWHFANGFVGGTRAAETFVWDKKKGLVGHGIHHVRAA